MKRSEIIDYVGYIKRIIHGWVEQDEVVVGMDEWGQRTRKGIGQGWGAWITEGQIPPNPGPEFYIYKISKRNFFCVYIIYLIKK